MHIASVSFLWDFQVYTLLFPISLRTPSALTSLI